MELEKECICCGFIIKNLYDSDEMWDGGVVEKIIAGFGSKFDMDVLTIAICDKCIEKNKLKLL